MSTEEEQHNLYINQAKENAYEILFERFCKIEKMFEFEKMILEEKIKELNKIVNQIIN